MPELPDIVVYIEALERRLLGKQLTGVRVVSPSVMRTYDPPYDAPVGQVVTALHRVGKRIVFEFGGSEDVSGAGGRGSAGNSDSQGGLDGGGESGGSRGGSEDVSGAGGRGSAGTSDSQGGLDGGGESGGSRGVAPPYIHIDLFLIIHLMVAGRLRWETPGKAVPKKVGLAAFDFADGSLILTEQGTKKRAGIWVVRGWDDVAALDRGGIEPLEVSAGEFAAALRSENRTLKRALTDPRLFSGIGNAYSDEILWQARLSSVKRTSQLSDEEVARLHGAVVSSLQDWTQRLRDEVGEGWPTKVTAFRDDMAVHGKFGEPCPRCGSKVQRIVYADNETNYCATCQTEGKLLADRSLSRLLKDDWPKTIEELEET